MWLLPHLNAIESIQPFNQKSMEHLVSAFAIYILDRCYGKAWAFNLRIVKITEKTITHLMVTAVCTQIVNICLATTLNALLAVIDNKSRGQSYWGWTTSHKLSVALCSQDNLCPVANHCCAVEIEDDFWHHELIIAFHHFMMQVTAMLGNVCRPVCCLWVWTSKLDCCDHDKILWWYQGIILKTKEQGWNQCISYKWHHCDLQVLLISVVATADLTIVLVLGLNSILSTLELYAHWKNDWNMESGHWLSSSKVLRGLIIHWCWTSCKHPWLQCVLSRIDRGILWIRMKRTFYQHWPLMHAQILPFDGPCLSDCQNRLVFIFDTEAGGYN